MEPGAGPQVGWLSTHLCHRVRWRGARSLNILRISRLHVGDAMRTLKRYCTAVAGCCALARRCNPIPEELTRHRAAAEGHPPHRTDEATAGAHLARVLQER